MTQDKGKLSLMTIVSLVRKGNIENALKKCC